MRSRGRWSARSTCTSSAGRSSPSSTTTSWRAPSAPPLAPCSPRLLPMRPPSVVRPEEVTVPIRDAAPLALVVSLATAGCRAPATTDDPPPHQDLVAEVDATGALTGYTLELG